MRLVALAAAASFAALLLLACGGSDPAPAAPAEPTAAPTEAAADVDDDAVVSTTPRVYFIHTEWWPTCRALRPVWEDLQQEYGDRIEFILVDRETDEGRQFVRDHGVPIGQPGFVVYNAAGEITYAALGPSRESGVRELVLSVLPE